MVWVPSEQQRNWFVPHTQQGCRRKTSFFSSQSIRSHPPPLSFTPLLSPFFSITVLPFQTPNKVADRVDLDPEPKHEAKTVLDNDIETYLAPLDVNNEMSESEPDSEFSDADDIDKVVETPPLTWHIDFSALKVSDLRVVAKCHGIKVFYKMRKGELLELFSEESG